MGPNLFSSGITNLSHSYQSRILNLRIVSTNVFYDFFNNWQTEKIVEKIVKKIVETSDEFVSNSIHLL